MPIILDTRIDAVSRREALERVRSFLQGGQHTIWTPNPEMLVDASKDSYFRDILNKGSLNICDGMGAWLVLAGRLKRIPGMDFMQDICALAEKEGKRVYLLGSGDVHIIMMAREVLKRRFPNLAVVGIHPGIKIQKAEEKIGFDTELNNKLVQDINTVKPDILFVGFGHGKQEKWIYEHLIQLPTVKVAMGVGGAFDVLGGKIPRAPRLLRILGLEWLWRLILEPRRFTRIWKATIGFLFLFFTYDGKESRV